MSETLEIVPTRAAIDALQQSMAELDQIEMPTRHHFAGGMYCREMEAPAGVTIVGKVHKSEHFFMLLAGEMTLVADGFKQRVAAPFITVSLPGIKRAGYAHTDCVCANVHYVGAIADVDEAESFLVEADPTARFDAYNRVKELEAQS